MAHLALAHPARVRVGAFASPALAPRRRRHGLSAGARPTHTPAVSTSPSRSAALTAPTAPPSPSIALPARLPASYIRGGTSKGVFFRASDLPADRARWGPILLRVLGSPDPVHARQLDGMGGGVSSLSKVVVVGPARNADRNADADAGADADSAAEQDAPHVEYTFVQIGVRDAAVDFSGNCGNLSAAVGPFALWAGLCAPDLPPAPAGPDDGTGTTLATVRALNTNTNKRVACTFPVLLPSSSSSSSSGTRTVTADAGPMPVPVPLLHLPQTSIAGVPGRASRVVLDFADPAGARTGRLLPTGRAVDVLSVPLSVSSQRAVRVSLVDATNPTVFVSAAELRALLSVRRGGAAATVMANDTDTDPNPDPDTDFDIDVENDAGGAFDFDFASPHVLDVLEAVRRAGAGAMGLDPAAQAQPKIAVVSVPFLHGVRRAATGAASRETDATVAGAGETEGAEAADDVAADEDDGADVQLHALSMGVLHRAVPMTLALCAGVAAGVPGTVPWAAVRAARARASRGGAVNVGSDGAGGKVEGKEAGEEDGTEPGARTTEIRIRHPSGCVDVGAVFGADGGVRSARVVRTVRRLMEGLVDV